MKKEDKKPLEKLAKLENPKTESFLISKATEINNEIRQSRNNDEIFELLDLLDAFAYRVGDICITIATFVIANKYDPQIHESPIGRFRGKSHKDLVLKTLEILNNIRYSKPDELLELSTKIFKDKPDQDISKKTLDIIKNLAKFDFFVLTKTKIGYGAQRKVLDYLLALSTQDKLSNFDVVETISREILSCEFEGSEWTKEDTLTFHSGAINPSDFLKKIRKQTIDLLKDLYFATEDVKIQLRLVNTLEVAVRSPGSVAYGDELAVMLAEDSRYVTSVFKEFLFSQGKTVANSLAAAKEIDQLLFWFKRHSKYSSPEVLQLRKDILDDPLYALFRMLVSDDVTYREEEGWDTAENKRSVEIGKLLDSISLENAQEWYDKLDKIASQNNFVENWTFLHFKDFLKKIATTKPEVAASILTRAFQDNSSLKDFIGASLEGFREVNNLKMWDHFAQVIIDVKNPSLVSALTYSLIRFGEGGMNKEIRQKDLDLLVMLINQTDGFTFLRDEQDKNFILHHSIINALVSNYSKDPAFLESLIISEVGKNPDYLEMYVRELAFAVWRKYIDFSELNTNGIKFVKDKLIEIRDLHWEAQQLLLDLGKKDLQIILDVFIGRIKRDMAQKEDHHKDLDHTPHYDAIPYHFNDELRKHVGEHPDYKEGISAYLTESTPDWSVYNWDLGELIQRIGISHYEIVMMLVQKNDKESLRRAVYLMNSIEGTDVNLLIEIVRRTDDKKVLNKIDALLYSTGVVSGEDGIARAYETKAKQLEQFKSDPSSLAKKYVKRMIKSFTESAKREFKRAEERKQIRKIEFEG